MIAITPKIFCKYRIFFVSVILVILLSFLISTPSIGQQSSNEQELEELYWQRINEEKMKFSEADVKFMTGMITHHAQALIMSRMAAANGASPAVKTLASRIINAQRDEITTMQKWLRDRNQPVPEVHIDGLSLIIKGDERDKKHRGMDHSKMPGMLTQNQLVELSKAKGEEFDKLFLMYMIQHHGGAIVMVRELFSQDGAAQGDTAFKLASDINVDQITEIERMRQMLNKLTESDKN